MSNIFMNIWFSVLKAIFTFLHVVYSGFRYFDLVWSLFKRKFVSTQSSDVDYEQLVARFATNLSKCPQHLAVIVGNDGINYPDIVNLIVWCLAAGISVLTVYDNSSFLKRSESKFYNYFRENAKVNPDQVIFRNIEAKKQKNGFSKKLFVNFLSTTDGKDEFIQYVKRTADNISHGFSKLSDITFEKMLEDMIDTHHLPSPELAIICGPFKSTFGYPPWSIRVTEFVHVETLKQFQAKEFCDMLTRYSVCQQRLGK